jgi:hypothetical protein
MTTLFGKFGRLSGSLALAVLAAVLLAVVPQQKALAKGPLAGTVLCTDLTYPSGDITCTYSSGPGSLLGGWVLTITDYLVSGTKSVTSGTLAVTGSDTFGLTYYNGAMGYNVAGFSPAGLLVSSGATLNISGATTQVNANTEVILGTMNQTGATNTVSDAVNGAGFYICPLGLTGCGFTTPPYGQLSTVAGTLEVSGQGSVGGVYKLSGNGVVTTTDLVTDNGGSFQQVAGNVNIYPQTTQTQNGAGGDGLYVGYQSTGSYTLESGILQMGHVNSSNQSSTGYEYVGYLAGSSGTFTQSGGSNLLSAVNPSGAAAGVLYVGYSGHGSYVQTGGILADSYPADEYLGYNPGSAGSFTQTGGDNGVAFLKGVPSSAAVEELYIGYRGTGSYTLGALGASANSALLYADYEEVGTNAYNASFTTIENGVGTFTQRAGTNAPSIGLFVGDNQLPGTSPTFLKSNGTPITPQGSYTLSGGALDAGGEYVGWATYGTISQSGASTNTTDSLELGTGTSTQIGYGSYDMSGGKLIASSVIEVGMSRGIGAFDQSGGLVDGQVVVGAGGTGSYLENGTTAQVIGDSETIAQSGGSGSFTQLRGSNSLFYTPAGSTIGFWESVTVGGSGGGTGTYNLGCTGGSVSTCVAASAVTLSAGNEEIGLSGPTGRGTLTQWGNTSNTLQQQLYVGEEGIGVYNLYGASSGAGAASLTAPSEQIGGGTYGTGTFNQAGGKNTVSGALTIALGTSYSPGTYAMTGGTLSAGSLTVSSRGTYEQTGATTSATIKGAAVNDGTILLNAATLTVDGSYTQSSGAVKTLLNGGTLDPTAISIQAGSFGGSGSVVGNTSVSGTGSVQVGAPSGSLDLKGNYAQSAGTLTFDIAANGSGFTVSSLVFTPGSTVSIDKATVVFDFLAGANPLTFFDSGKFVTDSFLQLSTGKEFSSEYNLATTLESDTFKATSASYTITGFAYNPVTGATKLTESGTGASGGGPSGNMGSGGGPGRGVPEPAPLTLLTVGLALLTWNVRRRASAGH